QGRGGPGHPEPQPRLWLCRDRRPLHPAWLPAVRMPQGFRFAGVNSGVKAFRKDLALIVSDVPAAAAGVFTLHLARAAPILELETRLPCEGVRALLVNAGNANALTGEGGREDVRALHRELASRLEVTPEAIISASTGIIGHRLPVARMVSTFSSLV